MFEGIGIALLVPIFELASAGDNMAAISEESNIMGYVIDTFNQLGIPFNLPVLMGLFVSLIIIRQVVQYIYQVYLVVTQQEIALNIRTKGFASSLVANINYHEKNKVGDIVNDLVTEVDRSISVCFALISGLGNLIVITVYMIVITVVSSWIAPVCLVLILLGAMLLRGLMQKSRRASEQLATANRSLSSYLINLLQSIRLVRLSNAERIEDDNFRKLTKEIYTQKVLISKLLAKIPLVIEPSIVSLMCLFVYLGVVVIGLSFEVILVTIGVIARLMPVAQELAKAIQVMQSGYGSLCFVEERLSSLSSAKEVTNDGIDMVPPNKVISFENVSFSYDDSSEVPALNNINAKIYANKLNALVGPSGSGKSTLVDLLPKLRVPMSGKIKIDGLELNDIAIKNLREHISFVSQDPYIFSGKIRDNIVYGTSNNNEQDMLAASRLAGAEEFINKLPEKFDTQLGERGVTLSGGQRQRLCLARALLRKSPILILDEPTSSLDTESIGNIGSSLLEICREKNTTIILISHGFSTITLADHIIVLEDGQVQSEGNHDSLMNAGGWYANAYSKQYA